MGFHIGKTTINRINRVIVLDPIHIVTRNPKYRAETYPTEWMPEDEELGLHDAAGQQLPFVDRIEITFFVQENPMWLEFKAGNSWRRWSRPRCSRLRRS